MSEYVEPIDPLHDRPLDPDVQEPLPVDTTDLAHEINGEEPDAEHPEPHAEPEPSVGDE